MKAAVAPVSRRKVLTGIAAGLAVRPLSVFADEARIRKQIKSAVTDTGDDQSQGMSEGVDNLCSLLKAANGMEAYHHHMEQFNNGGLRYADLKQDVAEALVALTNPFKEKKAELNANKRALKDQIKQSSWEIRKRAQQTVKEVKDLVGLLNVRF